MNARLRRAWGSAGRGALRLGCAASALAVANAAVAQESRGGVEIRMGAEVAQNPYLESGVGGGASAAVIGEVRPWYRQQSELTTFDLQGLVQARQFSSRFGLEDNYGASARIAHRASERVSVSGRASVTSSASRLGTSFDRLGTNPDDPALAPLPIDPLPEDPTLLGERGRTTALSAGAGVNYMIDERHQIATDLDFRDLSFGRVTARDYRSYAAQTRFTRVIDAATGIGVALGYRVTDYESTMIGDADTLTAMGSVTHRFNERLTLDASLGAARTEVEAGGGTPRRTFTSLAAGSSLCSRDSRGGLCVSYQRQPQASALGTVRSSDSLGLSFSRRLSERDNLSMGANYSRSGTIGGGAGISRIELLRGQATFQRRFTERVSGFLAASAAKTYRPDLAVKPNVNVGAGIAIRLGSRR